MSRVKVDKDKIPTISIDCDCGGTIEFPFHSLMYKVPCECPQCMRDYYVDEEQRVNALYELLETLWQELDMTA
jgi:hypothetical protein